MAPPVSETGPRTSATSGGTDEAMSAVLAQNWWVLALRGVLGILFGLIAFVYPGATMLSLVLVFAAYALVDGIFAGSHRDGAQDRRSLLQHAPPRHGLRRSGRLRLRGTLPAAGLEQSPTPGQVTRIRLAEGRPCLSCNSCFLGNPDRSC